VESSVKIRGGVDEKNGVLNVVFLPKFVEGKLNHRTFHRE